MKSAKSKLKTIKHRGPAETKYVSMVSKEEIRRRAKQAEKDRAFHANRVNTYAFENVITMGNEVPSFSESLVDLPGTREFMTGGISPLVGTVNGGKRCILDVRRFQVEVVNAGDGAVLINVMLDGVQKTALVPKDGKTYVSFPSFSSMEGNSKIVLDIKDFGGKTCKCWVSLKGTVGKHYQW